MNINNTVVGVYRRLAFFTLAAFFTGVVCYISLIVFYTLSSSWAAPITLSPTQEKVLTYQPQIATLEVSVNKQRVDLQTAIATEGAIVEQLAQAEKLAVRIDDAYKQEMELLSKTSQSMTRVLREKQSSIAQGNATLRSVKDLLRQTDQELAAKLITADQAAQRKIVLQSAVGSLVTERADAIQLGYQTEVMSGSARTLGGESSSIAAISSIKQALDVRAMISQLKIQLETTKQSIVMLKQDITNNERVLNVAKLSPYYKALREEVTVAFVPYDNLESMEVGDKVYDCYLQVLVCRKVGKVVTLYDAEEHAKHPLFKTDMRGRLVEIKFTDPDSSKSQVVFIGGKPLLL